MDEASITSLAWRSRQAAEALGISQRMLSDLTRRGEIPHVRLGRAVLYPRAELEAWLAAKAKGGALPA